MPTGTITLYHHDHEVSVMEYHSPSHRKWILEMWARRYGRKWEELCYVISPKVGPNISTDGTNNNTKRNKHEMDLN